jgi:hypothetical protein
MTTPTADAYRAFIERKSQLDGDHGFTVDADDLHASLFDFQRALVAWALRKGRAAIFADTGMGKTIMELVWADEVSKETGKPVLILTPLAVGPQFVREAERFSIDAARSHQGEITAPIVVTNYERLHHFDANAFGGVVCDESAILKSFEGETRKNITDVMRKMPYRLLATATPSPNDFPELGTSSEALGYLGYMDMLTRFFTNTMRSQHGYHGKWRMNDKYEWRFKGHAEQPFWRWVSSWARAMRKPSDLGFSDEGFDLPPLVERDHIVSARAPRPGMLFDLPAKGFHEEREERRRTIAERCEMAAALVNGTEQPALVWCHLNPEGDLLAKLIPDAVQVSGADSDDAKEAKFLAFVNGDTRVIVSKPVIGAWGLNFQHCAHVVTFASHSFEQTYQSIRRCWRYGQTRPVVVDTVMTEGEDGVRANLARKSEQADRMFASLVEHMNEAMGIRRLETFDRTMEVPAWLAS